MRLPARPARMITDTHCHLASRQFEGERDAVVGRAQAAGVGRLVTLATGFDDLGENAGMADRHPGVHACFAIHPCDVHTVPEGDDGWPGRLLESTRTRRAVAVGETGLDYYHPPPEGWDEEAFRACQRAFLRLHFEIAAASGTNIVLHTRDRDGHRSLEDALAVARDFRGRVRPLFHCFLGPWELAAPILALDGLVGFGGIATFPKAGAVHDAVRRAPAGCFLLESDSPYLAPVPHRGKRNEPAFTAITAAHIAGLRGESVDQLAGHTNQAADGFFRFGASG